MSSFQRHESQRAMNLQRPPISPNSPSYRLHHTNTKQHYSKSKNTQANKRFSVTPGGTPRNGRGAKIVYQTHAPEDHVTIHKKEQRLHERRRKRMEEMKQEIVKLGSELEETYLKNTQLSSTLKEATLVIKTQGEKQDEMLAALDEDHLILDENSEIITTLTTQNTNLSKDIDGLKKAWVDANIPGKVALINELKKEIGRNLEQIRDLEKNVKDANAVAYETQEECGLIEQKARGAMDNAVRALNNAAQQTSSAEEELCLMRQSLREAKCYTLHTTLGRISQAALKDKERLTRMVAHLQAAINTERNKVSTTSPSTASTTLPSSTNLPPFVSLSGAAELHSSGSLDINTGYAVIVNGRALYHFKTRDACLQYFNNTTTNVVQPRKLDLYSCYNVEILPPSTINGKEVAICIRSAASNLAEEWTLYPGNNSGVTFDEWTNALQNVVTNSIRLHHVETRDAELLRNVNQIRLSNLLEKTKKRMRNGNCFTDQEENVRNAMPKQTQPIQHTTVSPPSSKATPTAIATTRDTQQTIRNETNLVITQNRNISPSPSSSSSRGPMPPPKQLTAELPSGIMTAREKALHALQNSSPHSSSEILSHIVQHSLSNREEHQDQTTTMIATRDHRNSMGENSLSVLGETDQLELDDIPPAPSTELVPVSSPGRVEMQSALEMLAATDDDYGSQGSDAFELEDVNRRATMDLLYNLNGNV